MAVAIGAALVGRRLINPASGDWLARGLVSPLSLWCLALFAACLVGLGLLGGVLRTVGRSARLDADSGSAMVEFALVMPLAIVLGLVMFQSMLLMRANLCVHYAAYCGARTAIVAMPDGPRPVDPTHGPDPSDEPQNVIWDTHYSAYRGESWKARRVWRAAVWAALPVAAAGEAFPSGNAALQEGLETFFSRYGQQTPHWVSRRLDRKLAYAQDHTAVAISPPANGLTYNANEDVSVRVEHTIYLSVPYANWLFAQMFDGGTELAGASGEYGTVVETTCTLTNEGVQDFVEMESYEDLGGR
ncbi:MAG: pilus assembly protein [Phycisphaerae bacterium]|nr:pilus assembly protein [Phycisphaerae bacterium]